MFVYVCLCMAKGGVSGALKNILVCKPAVYVCGCGTCAIEMILIFTGCVYDVIGI